MHGRCLCFVYLLSVSRALCEIRVSVQPSARVLPEKPDLIERVYYPKYAIM
jgi:hypothetical protein